jgi:hypothetical protein
MDWGSILGGLAYLVPVFVRELFGGVSSLDTGAVHQNLWLDSLAGQCGDDVFNGLSIAQLGDVNIGLATKTVYDLIFG